ncbi:hypothetical protein MP228_004269 [Amoeboaphelidium protococcarum]|nr:hypothetical protein MP228_004269 [Amoeboaphelidium protococcarum]
MGAAIMGEHQASGMPLRVGAYLYELPGAESTKLESRVKASPTSSQSSTRKEKQYQPPLLWTMQLMQKGVLSSMEKQRDYDRWGGQQP